MEDLEPTFYLDGQSYVFTDEVCRGGPELAALALKHTLGYIYLILGEWSAGRMSAELRLKQQTELIMGARALRELIPSTDVLIPNAGLLTQH